MPVSSRLSVRTVVVRRLREARGVRGRDLRLDALRNNHAIEIPEPHVPLFASHRDAAAHGLRDINKITPRAAAMIDRLVRKYPRLTPGEADSEDDGDASEDDRRRSAQHELDPIDPIE